MHTQSNCPRAAGRGPRAAAMMVLALLGLGAIAGDAAAAAIRCVDANGNVSYQSAACPEIPAPAVAPGMPEGAPVRAGAPRAARAAVPPVAAPEPDDLSDPAEVVELVTAAELCLRLPRFAGEHRERVAAWKTRNVPLIDRVRRDARLAPQMARRVQAARQPIRPDDVGPLEAYCGKLAERFLPRLPLIVGANAPGNKAPQPGGDDLVGTWQLLSIADTATGSVKPVDGAAYLRFYSDGTVVSWKVPGPDVRQGTYKVEAGQLVLAGAPRNHGTSLRVTGDAMRYYDGAGGTNLFARMQPDLEPPR